MWVALHCATNRYLFLLIGNLGFDQLCQQGLLLLQIRLRLQQLCLSFRSPHNRIVRPRNNPCGVVAQTTGDAIHPASFGAGLAL